MNQIRKKLIVFMSIAFIFLCYPNGAFAACSHSSLGPLYSEAAHPHAYYRTCSLCNTKVYTGSYATKQHGNGAWGSGTCPSCGTHTFIGQSCTTSGTCACGATQPPFGHSFGPLYSEAAHPHAYYKTCSRCNSKTYTGGYETKQHGNGAWGSGTCPDCGTHTFIGATCTSGGTCSCGATQPALGHSFGTSSYHETAHPHKIYLKCIRCATKNYTGSTKTLQHGPATSTTCPQCGNHSYVPDPNYGDINQHPHEAFLRCSCGSTKSNGYGISPNCPECLSGSKTALVQERKPSLVTIIDDFPTVIAISIDISYEEVYKKDEFGFASLSAHCTADGYAIPYPYESKIDIGVNAEVPYYSSNNSNLFSATLIEVGYPVQFTPGDKIGSPFRNASIPAYSCPGAYVFAREGLLTYDAVSITANYSY